jgi:hypothetical protein
MQKTPLIGSAFFGSKKLEFELFNAFTHSLNKIRYFLCLFRFDTSNRSPHIIYINTYTFIILFQSHFS